MAITKCVAKYWTGFQQLMIVKILPVAKESRFVVVFTSFRNWLRRMALHCIALYAIISVCSFSNRRIIFLSSIRKYGRIQVKGGRSGRVPTHIYM